jgi:hypothetical protein
MDTPLNFPQMLTTMHLDMADRFAVKPVMMRAWDQNSELQPG